MMFHVPKKKKNYMVKRSGGELLEMRLLDSHLLDTFGRKSTARHKIDKPGFEQMTKKVTTARQCRAIDTQYFATVKCKSSIIFI